MKGACGTSKKARTGDKKGRAAINGGLCFKESAGSKGIPCVECVVTGENPLCGGDQNMLRGHQQQWKKKSWHITVIRNGGSREKAEKEDRVGDGVTGRVKNFFFAY